MNVLGLRFNRDPDLELHGLALTELRWKCGLPPCAFISADRAMSRIAGLPLGGNLLCRSGATRPYFRFCPVCLTERAHSSLPIQWRFDDWRHCPRHLCLMEDRCRRCKYSVRGPVDIAASNAGKQGYASRRRCLNCLAELSGERACPIDFSSSSSLSDLEIHWLQAGCEIVKALFRPRVDIDIAPVVRRALEMDWLPSDHQWAQIERHLREVDGVGADQASPLPPKYRRLRTNWANEVFCTSRGS